MLDINRDLLKYMVGGLLYMPAFQKNIVEKIKSKSIPCLTSIAFCLEDSIRDEALTEAEDTLKNILQELSSLSNCNIKLPMIFARVRSPEHLQAVHNKMSNLTEIMTGYILPKFDLNNAENYCAVIYEINRHRNRPFYIMPILETEMIADINSRNEALVKIKRILDVVEEYVLNIRVGVNDLGNIYGLRRDIRHTAYDIGIIRDIFVSILNVFAKDYIVASSVWNYFDDGKSKDWIEGLKHELILDRLNGFIGKSAIHPSQLPYIFESLKVNRADLDDAEQILNWQSETYAVMKGSGRMNELKCHTKWAECVKILSVLYGVKDDL